MKAPLHPEQQARLVALRGYDILDTEPDADLDDVVRVVSEVCGTPIALVSLVDENRQWFKAKSGLDVSETPIEASVCAHGILQPDLLEIGDLTKDVRTIDNPIVAGDPNLRFYAGAALINNEGLPLGMLCVLDYKPRELTPAQRDLLTVMAKLVMQRIELKRALKQERAAHAMVQEVLDKANALLDRNALLRREIDHRVKNSLTQVVSFLRLQQRQHRDEPAVTSALAEASNRVAAVAQVHDHLHHVAEDDKVSLTQFLTHLADEISRNRPPQLKSIEVHADNTRLASDKVLAVGLAVNEAVANAMKHAFGPEHEGVVHIAFSSDGNTARLRVSDNGRGLPEGFQPSQSKGLGMRALSGIAQQLGGTLSHKSDGGTTLEIVFPVEPAPASPTHHGRA